MIPDFLVIGAFKAGTTSLHQYFAQHPGVFMTRVKEPNYFSFDPENPDDPAVRRNIFPVRTLAAYQALFDDAPDGARRGDASPGYLHSPAAAERMHRLLPEARLIASLRSPVERAYSHYLMDLRNGLTTDSEPPMRPDQRMWFRASLYGDAVARYLSLYGRERIRFIRFEDLSQRPQAVMSDLFAFIGVDPNCALDTSYSHNPGGLPRFPHLYRILMTVREIPGLASLTPEPLRKLYARVRDSNLRKARQLDADRRAEWARYFRADIQRTAELTGLDLSAWVDT
jgi:hypothetical protein